MYFLWDRLKGVISLSTCLMQEVKVMFSHIAFHYMNTRTVALNHFYWSAPIKQLIEVSWRIITVANTCVVRCGKNTCVVRCGKAPRADYSAVCLLFSASSWFCVFWSSKSSWPDDAGTFLTHLLDHCNVHFTALSPNRILYIPNKSVHFRVSALICKLIWWLTASTGFEYSRLCKTMGLLLEKVTQHLLRGFHICFIGRRFSGTARLEELADCWQGLQLLLKRLQNTWKIIHHS